MKTNPRQTDPTPCSAKAMLAAINDVTVSQGPVQAIVLFRKETTPSDWAAFASKVQKLCRRPPKWVPPEADEPLAPDLEELRGHLRSALDDIEDQLLFWAQELLEASKATQRVQSPHSPAAATNPPPANSPESGDVLQPCC
jgi:hypothetical protein